MTKPIFASTLSKKPKNMSCLKYKVKHQGGMSVNLNNKLSIEVISIDYLWSKLFTIFEKII